ncbi:MAG TPA: amino acid adenylation domain-containing protein [Thermoanaerobaculia bacterium]|nr:amino acid adenylation domain-containing protein [Thermoanaerobaculia bacterium]
MEADPDRLAYVIYTSGSTGRPKGVMVSHRGLAAYLGWAHGTYPRGGSLAHTSISFDLTVTSLFVPLLAGERVVLVPESAGPEGLGEALRREEGLGFVKLTPSHLRLLDRQLAGSELAGRTRSLILGGEALSAEDLAAWREHAPETVVYNEYGPTETVVGCSLYAAPAGELAAGPVPIGRPIAGARLDLLDAYGTPVPRGVAGELFIGGAGVARGYLARPDLTAARFVPDGLSGASGARLYRTGDLARFRPDGVLEFLGRIDQQVKVRGHRIEPGEIEAAIAAHPGVREAVVLVRGEGADGARLVAYVVPASRTLPPSEELRSHLLSQLPEHMVPAAWVAIPEVPLTPNGKLDREALPDPDEAHRSETPYVAPRTPEEEILAGVWCQALGVDRVGIDDDYFALGGDSIRSLQVVGLAREKGIVLSLDLLFKRRTLRELAGALREAGIDAAERPRTEPFSLISAEDRRRLPEDVEDAFPLSRLQAGMLYHRELHPGSAIYHDIIRFHLRSPLDLETLSAAAQGLVERHPALRTSFAMTGYSEPLQLVHRTGHIPLAVEDLRHLSPAEQEEVLEAWVEEEKRRGFNPAELPLIRYQVHRRSDETFQFSLSFHHAIIDGWSDATMLTELALSHLALLRGHAIPFEPPATHYRDFVALEQEALASAEARGYWLDLLAGSSFVEVPRWRTSPASGTTRGVLNLLVPLGDEIGAGLQRLALQTAVPLKNVLLAAHLRALAALSGQPDILTALTSSGRLEARDGERVLGLFLNSIPFRLRLPGGTWSDLVRETYRAEEASLPYRRYPLAEVQRLRGGQRMAETAFYFTHYHVFQDLLSFPELAVLGYRAYEETSFTLVANFGQNPYTGRLRFQLTGDQTQLSLEQLQAIGGVYARVLAAMAATPLSRYDAADLLSPEERWQIVAEWNDTAASWPRGGSVPERFAAQAARTPEAPAVVFEGEVLTYAELDRRSGRLAAHLRRQGVGPESVVAVGLERSAGLVAALLGVMRSGAAYLPLDPSYPQDRLAFMLADSGAAAQVTARDLEEAYGLAGELAPFSILPESPAYVIYTSGSTGQPKGAVNTHGALENRLLWMQEAYGLTAEDRVLQKTPASFDVSVWEFFWPLITGACLVVAKPGGHQDNAYLVDLVAREGVTTLHFVPSMLRFFLEEPDLSRAASLKRVIASGEALSPELEQRFFERLGAPFGTALHNLYGPTEAAIDVTAWACRPEDGRAAVPLGRPIANLAIHLLDRWLLPVPIGVPGELHIGGAGLARGYHRRPGLSAERFIPSPWGEGERLYKTGDLARRLPDGTLEFLGRIDHQVKLRGFRIELGEIESVLAGHPAVAEAVVAARQDTPGDTRLVAYLVPRGEETVPPAAELRRHLLARLPEHMVPAAFVFLPALPLTPSGKVDRRALPAPERLRPDLASAWAPPRNPVEEVLAGIWEEVLGLPQVGIHDLFTDLGGHSLLATQVVARARRAFGIDLPLRALFEASTVAHLAERIEAARREGTELRAPAIRPVPRAGDLPLSFAQERLWFFDQLEPGSPAYNIPTLSLLSGGVDPSLLGRALSALVLRHEALRTTFPTAGGRPAQRIHPPFVVEVPEIDLRALPEPVRESEAARLSEAEALRPFDLVRGPLLRAATVRLGEGESRLLLTVHHIVADGWSMSILLREIGALYGAFAAGRPSPLPPLPIQYADYASWQREWLSGEVVEAQLGYWRERLAGAPPVLELPADRVRPAVQTYGGAREPLALSASGTEALKRLGRQEGATLFMTLLAGFQVLLSRASGQSDVSVGTLIAGRNHVEIEGLVGFFLNTLVLRTDVSGEPTFRALLARAREASLGAHAHQDVPFEKLVEELQPVRDLRHTPLFQVLFVLQNLPHEELRLPGLTLTPLRGERKVANFDLSLVLEEAEGTVSGALEYNHDLFDAATVRRTVEQLKTLLAAAAAEPDRPVAELPLMPAAELDQVLRRWNDTAVAFPLDRTVHELFAEQAARTPEAPALSWRGERLTYRELDRRTNRAAHRLREAGIGRGALVALFLHRSPALAEAVLGTFKAGAAYLPLDPLHPAARSRQVLGQAAPGAVVTTEALAPALAEVLDGLPAGARPRVLRIEDLTAPGPEESLPAAAGPGDLAYVIFTSGSTGLPKGAMVEHVGMLNHLFVKVRDLELTAADVVAQTASQCFDISVWQLLAALLVGGRVHVVDDEVNLEPRRLLAEVRSEGVTILETVPSLLRVILDERSAAAALPLRWLIATGEALPAQLCRDWLAIHPEVPLLNAYGPTECSDDVTHHPVRTAPPASALVPIGPAVANLRLYVLDRSLRPVPPGTLGELCVAGVGVGRGYLGAPRRTAEVFVPDPLASRPGERLYRTGDLARFLPDGVLEFRGRLDHQVKIRGFRIELGEIEAVLSAEPGVREAAVLARRDRPREGAAPLPGEARLVAYLVPEAGGTVDAAGLRSRLRERLPDYMVPAAFVALDRLPLTANGKLDRKALPAPEEPRPELEPAYLAPRSSVEEVVAGIFSEVIGIGRAGVFDNFFDLGGHSLLATQAVLRINDAFEIEMPLRTLFERPTVAELALVIEDLVIAALDELPGEDEEAAEDVG